MGARCRLYCAGRLRSILRVRRNDGKWQGRDLNAFGDQSLGFGGRDFAMDAGTILFAIMHGARLVGKVPADPSGISEQFLLRLLVPWRAPVGF